MGTSQNDAPRNAEDTLVRAESLDQFTDDSISGLNAFVTKSGLMGSVYSAVNPGDLICIFYGGKMPFVLRPHQHPSKRSTEFQFIGSCYGKCFYSQPSARRYSILNKSYTVDGAISGVLMDQINPIKFVSSLQEQDFTLT